MSLKKSIPYQLVFKSFSHRLHWLPYITEFSLTVALFVDINTAEVYTKSSQNLSFKVNERKLNKFPKLFRLENVCNIPLSNRM